jgi:serine/threonine-protein kinase
MPSRYRLHHELGRGAMASVHLATLDGPLGFRRTVAIKKPHAFVFQEVGLAAMLIDEARIASKISHPNVVATLDVIEGDGELSLVMDYVHGATLAHLMEAQGGPVPPAIAVAIVAGVLHGLHAAHEARGDGGEPLGIVHRDVSPQNVLVGSDGVARLADFGIAKAAGRLHTTREGHVKGKVAYMAPEQLRGGEVDRRTDVYAASVIVWELLAGKPLFRATTAQETLERALVGCVRPPSRYADVPEALDTIVTRGLELEPRARFSSAREMATALEAAITPASVAEVSDWVERLAHAELEARTEMLATIATATDVTPPRPRRTRWPWIAAMIALAAIAAIALFFAMRPPSAAPSAAGSVASTGTHEAAPSAVPSTVAPVMIASASEQVPAVPPPVHGVRAVTRARAHCDPPFVIDSAGRKAYKRECLP